MALDVEGVVDGAVRGEEALSGAGGLEPLHLALPSSHRLVRVLRPIVLAQALLVFCRHADLGFCGAIGGQFVRDEQARRKAELLHELA